MPDWKLSSDYDFINSIRPELIAWQFLRRNPEYQKDYQWFISVWNELETKHGAPPNRDFESWKNDPRASRSESEIYNLTKKITADDNLLIECWMGTKWGFYKFPVDPDNKNPIFGKDLTWRTNPIKIELITDNIISEITVSNLDSKAAIIFNLQQNLKEQIQSAKQQLIIAQKNTIKNSSIKQHWITCLRVIDAIENNNSEHDIQNTLKLSHENYLTIKSQCHQLTHGRYLEIITTV